MNQKVIINLKIESVYDLVYVSYDKIGMIFLSIFGDEMANFRDADDVQQLGSPRAAIRALFNRLEAEC